MWAPLTVFYTAAVICVAVGTESVQYTAGQSQCENGTYQVEDRCVSCSACRLPNEVMELPCNQTHDVVCRCRPGFYRALDGQCTECTKCRVGWGASPACTAVSNTVCIPCPRGSYSSVLSSSRSCQSCTQCGHSQFLFHQCTSEQDTVCFGYKAKEATVTPVTTVDCAQGSCGVKDSGYMYTTPLYCTILGAVIVGLLVYVVLRCRTNKERTVLSSQGSKIGSHKLPGRSSYAYQQYAETKNCPIVYLQQDGEIVTAGVRYSELPSATRKSVQRAVSHNGSWLKLAHCLGFTPSQISDIQRRAERDSNRRSVSSLLLCDWSKRTDSTVGIMLHALAAINRPDLISLIYSCNSMSGSDVV